MQYGLYFDIDSKNKSIYMVDANKELTFGFKYCTDNTTSRLCRDI